MFSLKLALVDVVGMLFQAAERDVSRIPNQDGPAAILREASGVLIRIAEKLEYLESQKAEEVKNIRYKCLGKPPKCEALKGGWA